ncbi:hypothetical protein QJS10_CPA01g00793 [Acorus calamus]|uniref:RNase H type-1 domain-containing protein n=1 Tax=Acorus calamus TaxID=4465 RepID=A0AAV9FJF7_ACOCL|nr:hypothetical protein QJS10_CPA01g00793 [Acorus calamus]
MTDPVKKELVHIILTTTIWSIWTERNNRLFTRKKNHKIIILRRIEESIHLRTIHKVFNAIPMPDHAKIMDAFRVTIISKEQVTSMVKWLSPHAGWHKLNTDGSLADDRGGYGALLRDEKADFIIGLAGRLDLPSINLLELKAIEQGVVLGCSISVKKLWIETDSTTARAWLTGR